MRTKSARPFSSTSRWMHGGVAAASLLALPAFGLPTVVDLAPASGFQAPLGQFQRGRALVAADFDLDGRVDFYFGNPGDASFIVRQVVGPGGEISFELAQTLLDGALAWSAVAADFDNDGDPDLFVGNGGNEGVGYGVMYRNLARETGTFAMIDVTAQAGVAGPIPTASDLHAHVPSALAPDDGCGEPSPIGGESAPIVGVVGAPLAVAHAGAVVGDYDRDGDDDLFVSVNIESASSETLRGRNILWRNDGPFRFVDATVEAGLDGTRLPTRHSTFFDADNDGDLDLYESNNQERNVFWRSLLVETGEARFADATVSFSALPVDDLSFPFHAFASCAADFDDDGWEDLLVVKRGAADEAGSPYPAGHHLFRNLGPLGFTNVATAAGLNESFVGGNGVMGCQIGDLDGDGRLDVFVGNGGPLEGTADQLFLGAAAIPPAPLAFVDASAAFDFPAEPQDGIPQAAMPPYPYRTHGSAILDVDGDGTLELAVLNGGPAAKPDSVREPNRLFRFSSNPPRRTVTIAARGNGLTVARDAVGTRLALTVREPGGATRVLHRTLYGGSCFSAQNGFEIAFGLGESATPESLVVVWPDGATDLVVSGLAAGARVEVVRAPDTLFLSGFEHGNASDWNAVAPLP